MARKFDPMLCVLVQSDDWSARPVKLRSFGGHNVGFPSPISLNLAVFDYNDSSPRLELKVMVPKATSTAATYFGPKMEPPSKATNHPIIIRLEAQSLRSFKWKRFTADELQLPADAVAKGQNWTVFELTVQKPAVQGWPMPFECQHEEAHKCFQAGQKLGSLTATMAQLCGDHGVITLATPAKPKHPQISDIQAVLNKKPFAYFDYGSADWRNMEQYSKKKIQPHRDLVKKAPSYSPVVAYPTPPQAAVAMEQSVLQDIIDVCIDVKTIRTKTLEVRLVRKDPKKDNQYWALVKFSERFKTLFGTSLKRLQKEDEFVGLAFSPPPAEGKADDDVWPCRIVTKDIGFKHQANLVLDCHRPNRSNTAKDETSRKKVVAVDTWEEDRVFNLGHIDNDTAPVNPTIFGAKLPGAVVKLPPQPSAVAANPTPSATSTGNLTKERNEELAKLKRAQALERDIAQGQSLASLMTETFKPITQFNFLDRHSKALEQAILDRIHVKGREAFKTVLGKVPLGILPIVGFAGSGKTDLMATTILLAIGIGPVIVCTPTDAAATNIAARVQKLGSLAYKKVNMPEPVIIRGFPWRVDERRAKARATKQDAVATTDDDDDEWEHSLSIIEWMKRIFWPKDENRMKPGLQQLVKRVNTDQQMKALKETLQKQGGWNSDMGQAFRELAQDILNVADVVCCTTHASTNDLINTWASRTAKATFIDEAGAVSMPEALVPWFNGRPLVVAGDVRQLSPCVMTLDQKNQAGGPVNFFEKHLEMSILERLMRMGWPCWSSKRQNRIVNGGFDLAGEIFYPELGESFEYGAQCAVEKRPNATRIESWLRGRFPVVKPSPKGKIWPVFINCTRTFVETIDTSRLNKGQAEITLALMETLIKARETNIVVVSPYKITKAYLEECIQKRLRNYNKDSKIYKGLSNVQVSTADSFQGKEADVAVFLTTVTQASGPGFVKDPRRFKVGITRHVDFLFVIGDITTMDNTKDVKEEVMVSEQGGRVIASGKKTRDAYNWLRAKGRVAEVNYRDGEKAWF